MPSTDFYPATGNVARIFATFTDYNGNFEDPQTVTCTVRSPDTTSNTAPMVKDNVGQYHFDLNLTQSGTYYYRTTGTGVVNAQSAWTSIVVPADPF